MTRIVLLAFAAALLAAVIPAVDAPTATAHATVVATVPASGATAPDVPGRVSATFDEDLEPAFAALTVVGGDGSVWSLDQVMTSGPQLSVPLRPDTPAGSYTARYRVVSTDGHAVTGSWRFDITRAGPGPTR